MRLRSKYSFFAPLALCLTAVLLLAFFARLSPAQAALYRRGSSGDEVRQIQQVLIRWGYLSGEADGIYGKQTAAGVTEAQRLLAAAGYDVAQTAICFLYQFKGRTVHEIYGKDRKGKEITIKLACYREVDHFINLLRNRPDRRGTVVESIDFTDYKALPMDPVNCFEQEQTDYTKYDELVGALQLSALELAILNCYMNGMVQSEVCAELGIGRGRINSRKASIRQRYYNLYGAY